MISEFPLFVFTTLSGIAAGAYFMSALFPKVREGGKGWLFPLVVIVLLGIGLLGTLTHLGHPERFLNALTQPSAMIAQEAYWSMAFGVLALVDCIMLKAKGASPRALQVIGAIAALGLMCVTANAYFTSHAVPEWTTWASWPLFIGGDLAMGAALVGLFKPELYSAEGSFVTAYAVAAVLALIGLAGCCAAFAGAPCGTMPFIAGIVIGPVASSAVAFAAKAQKMGTKPAAILACVLCVVGIAVARYFFYTVSIL